jgi:hypothetical protein
MSGMGGAIPAVETAAHCRNSKQKGLDFSRIYAKYRLQIAENSAFERRNASVAQAGASPFHLDREPAAASNSAAASLQRPSPAAVRLAAAGYNPL